MKTSRGSPNLGCFEHTQSCRTAAVLWVPFLMGGLLLGGCVTTESTIYLQQLESETAVNQPPVVFTMDQKAKDVQLSMTATSIRSGTVHGTPESPQYGGPGPDSVLVPPAEALAWTPSSGMLALNLRYMASGRFAISGGLVYAWGRSSGLLGGNVGVGLSNSGTSLGFHIETGVQIRRIVQSAQSVVVQTTTDFLGNEYTSIGVSLDHARSTVFDFYASMTLNTTFQASPVNFFLQLAITEQTFGSFVPSGDDFWVEDTRVTEGVALFSAAPGISLHLGKSERLLLGVRMTEFLSNREWKPGRLWHPFLQFDVTFGEPAQ